LSRNRVLVEIDPATQLPIRIFRVNAEAWRMSADRVREWPKRDAVEAIRRQVFERDKYECRHCGALVTWKNGEMNEIKPKGDGGEVSLANCELLCYGCHQGGKAAVHGDRRWGGRATL